MEQIYALGVSIIQSIQYWFSDSEDFFELVNNVSNPHIVFEVLFPLVATFDSVFASQLLLVLGFGGWLNTIVKWWLLEDRPYWWVQETSYYTAGRPQVRQTSHSCETGPGSPSGHSATTASTLLLIVMWISHMMHDRKYYVWWWKYAVYPVAGAMMISVMMARLFVATHFPHQVVLGAMFGAFLAPALCIYVTDPFIWQYGIHSKLDPKRTIMWHIVAVGLTVVIGLLTYWSMKWCGIDPMGTVKLAFRWCTQPEHIRVTTTPMFSLVQSTGAMLGWAIATSPELAKYRHYTRKRSLILAALGTFGIAYGVNYIQENVCKEDAWTYYSYQFLLYALKSALLLRLVPEISRLYDLCCDDFKKD